MKDIKALVAVCGH